MGSLAPMTEDGIEIVPGGTYWLDEDDSFVVKTVEALPDSMDVDQYVHQVTTEDGLTFWLHAAPVYGSRRCAVASQRGRVADAALKAQEQLNYLLRYLARLDAELAKES